MEIYLPSEITIDILSRLPVETVLDCKKVSKNFNSLVHHPSFAHLHLRRQLLQLVINEDKNVDDDNEKADEEKKDQTNKKDADDDSEKADEEKNDQTDKKDVDDDKEKADEEKNDQTIEKDVDEDNEKADEEKNDQTNKEHQFSAAVTDKVGFVFLVELQDANCHLFYGEYDENDEYQSYKSPKKLNHPPLQSNSVMVGSCNGIICMCVNHHGVQDPIYFLNPITREYVYLPPFEDNSLNGSLGGRLVFGFGYSTIVTKYKVVRIYFCSAQPTVGHVEVYTLGDGRGWRNIGEINYTTRFLSIPPHAVFADGALHWLAFGDGKIVSFDLAEEKFSLLPPPPPNLKSGDYYQLQELGGSLCAFNQEENGCVNIWALKKKETPDQDGIWTWAFSLDCEQICEANFMDEYEPFALTKTGEVLLWYCGGHLTCYNLKNGSLMPLVGYVPQWELFEAFRHMNSFVSLKALGEDANIIG